MCNELGCCACFAPRFGSCRGASRHLFLSVCFYLLRDAVFVCVCCGDSALRTEFFFFFFFSFVLCVFVAAPLKASSEKTKNKKPHNKQRWFFFFFFCATAPTTTDSAPSQGKTVCMTCDSHAQNVRNYIHKKHSACKHPKHWPCHSKISTVQFVVSYACNAKKGKCICHSPKQQNKPQRNKPPLRWNSNPSSANDKVDKDGIPHKRNKEGV